MALPSKSCASIVIDKSVVCADNKIIFKPKKKKRQIGFSIDWYLQEDTEFSEWLREAV